MASKKKIEKVPTPFGQARVNVTWMARALEDGASLVDSFMEVYDGQGRLFAKDLRTLLNTPWVPESGGGKPK